MSQKIGDHLVVAAFMNVVKADDSVASPSTNVSVSSRSAGEKIAAINL